MQRSPRTVDHRRSCGLGPKKNGEPLKDFNQVFPKMLAGAKMEVSGGNK